MEKKKGIAVLVTVLLAVVFYFMYSSSITYWDAYAYEVHTTNEIDPMNTLNLTAADLAGYPKVESAFSEASEQGFALVTFEDGGLYEFDDLLESQNEEMEQGYVFIQYDEAMYEVDFTSYGGVDDEPIYLYLSYLFGAITLVLGITLVLPRIRGNN